MTDRELLELAAHSGVELQKAVFADRKDAQRYRWLRAQCEMHDGMTITSHGDAWSGDDPDRRIDSAMSTAPADEAAHGITGEET